MTAPHLSPWTETDSLVFVSGQLAFDENRTLSAADIDGQTTQTIKNIAQVWHRQDSPSPIPLRRPCG